MQIIKKTDLLPFIKKFLPSNPVIVEAGAFTGHDTEQLSSFWPDGIVHAFEPVPEIFTMLEQRTREMPNVFRYPYALSDKEGTATLFVSSKPSKPDKPFQAGSLLKPKERLAWSDVEYKQTIQVPTITLDAWAKQEQISHVDFFWLDLQGMELAVMQAAPLIVATARVIYTEVEFIEAYAGQPLYEQVKMWLESQGFREAARDFTDQSTWFFGNIVMVRE